MNAITKLGVPQSKKTAEEKKRQKILSDLNNYLKQSDEVGGVVSIVTYRRAKGSISCYGHSIKPDLLFAKLNLSTQTAVSYLALHTLNSYRVGHLVKLNNFEPNKDDDLWVAIIGIMVADLNFEAIPFPRHPALP